MKGFEIINIAGTDYPVNFGTNTIRCFEEFTQISANEISDKGSLTANMLYLMYFGLKDGARVEKKSFDLEIEDVADLLDKDGEEKGNDKSAAVKIGNLWLRANGYPELNQEEEKEQDLEKKTDQKKLIGKN